MAYGLPADLDERPVAVVGAGTLGRRIATVYAAAGSDVRIHDPAAEQREAARAFVDAQADTMAERLGLHPSRRGAVHVCADLAAALAGAWMVVEAVRENVHLKIEVFGELDRLAEPDAILCSNSSSLASSRLIGRVRDRGRVLNTHYQMPPDHNAVELMSCGFTDEGLIDELMERFPRYGIVPFRVLRESDGFIFNRIWAAVKRECLMVVEEGVASAEDVDAMWTMFTASGVPPFRMMDRVGLDVVLAIEEHYASVRDGIPEGPRTLLQSMIEQGRLGAKSGGGFYRNPA